MPTKLDLLLRRSFFQGMASCRGIGSSGKHLGTAGRLEQVQGFDGALVPLESVRNITIQPEPLPDPVAP